MMSLQGGKFEYDVKEIEEKNVIKRKFPLTSTQTIHIQEK